MVTTDEGKAQAAALLGAVPTAVEFRALCIGEGGSVLSAAMTNSQNTVPVTELAAYDDPATLGVASITVKIDSEEITYTGKSAASGAGNLTGATRGANSTTADVHSSGRPVVRKPQAKMTRLSKEIRTIGGERRSSPASNRTGGADTNVARSRVQTSVADDTARYDTTFAFTGTVAVREAMLNNDGTVPATQYTKQGTSAFLQIFDEVNVASGDSLRLISDVQVQ